MKKNNAIQEKTFAFAIRTIRLYQYLSKQKHEYILSKQLLRAGTSIGANVEEAIGAQSDRDFISKLSIAYKESRESSYWLRLLKATDYLTDNQADSMLSDVEEICRIIGKIQTTIKTR